MKHSGKTFFSVNNKVINYVDKMQDEYVIRFVEFIPKLYALVKPIKDLTTLHTRVVHLSYKNLLHMREYVMGMDKVASPAPNDICG